MITLAKFEEKPMDKLSCIVLYSTTRNDLQLLYSWHYSEYL